MFALALSCLSPPLGLSDRVYGDGGREFQHLPLEEPSAAGQCELHTLRRLVCSRADITAATSTSIADARMLCAEHTNDKRNRTTVASSAHSQSMGSCRQSCVLPF